MKIALVIVAIIIVVCIFVFKTSTQPSTEEIEKKVPEEKIISEIDKSLVSEFANAIEGKKLREELKSREVLWNSWIEHGYKLDEKLTVDYYYYSSTEEKATKLKSRLEKVGFYVNVFPETTLIVLKGWKIKTQIRRIWDLETLKSYNKIMHLVGEQEGPVLEGVAAQIN